jgi:hypothetical protein
VKTKRSDRGAIRGGRRGIVVFVAGALAMGLGVTGVHAAFGGGSSSPPSLPHPTFRLIPARPFLHPAETRPAPLLLIQTLPKTMPDANALADGVYATYIHGVDVRGATITVDVIQIFEGEAAHKAAIQDGKPWVELRNGPTYIRNESPLLRTLPVAFDVHIKLIGICVDPERSIALRQLRQAITPFTYTFYYDVSVVGGRVENIQQFVAVAGC